MMVSETQKIFPLQSPPPPSPPLLSFLPLLSLLSSLCRLLSSVCRLSAVGCWLSLPLPNCLFLLLSPGFLRILPSDVECGAALIKDTRVTEGSLLVSFHVSLSSLDFFVSSCLHIIQCSQRETIWHRNFREFLWTDLYFFSCFFFWKKNSDDYWWRCFVRQDSVGRNSGRASKEQKGSTQAHDKEVYHDYIIIFLVPVALLVLLLLSTSLLPSSLSFLVSSISHSLAHSPMFFHASYPVASSPVLRFDAELGGVSPLIVVPGKYVVCLLCVCMVCGVSMVCSVSPSTTNDPTQTPHPA